MISTVEKGNRFRDQVIRVMSAAGYEMEGPEVRASHIRADAATWTKLDAFGDIGRVLIEAKDYEGNLPKPVVESFVANYLSLVQSAFQANVQLSPARSDGHSYGLGAYHIVPDYRGCMRDQD